MAAAANVVLRYKGAFEHPSEEDLKRYLKKHPQADPSRHTVKKQEEKPKPQEEEGHVDEKPKHEEEGGSKGGLFKRLSDKAKALVGHSSAAVQKLVADGEHRKRVLGDAGKAVLASPKTYAKRLLHTAKHEVKEFKEAGSALKAIMSGKKPNEHEKKALKTVAIHMSVAVAAAALSSTGVLAGAVALGKGMAQKIAMKAAMKSLEKVHLLNEISHIGHGIHHLMEFFAAEKGDQSVDPEEAFAILVMRSVQKELESFSDDDMAELLNEVTEEQQKTAWNINAATASDLDGLLNRAGGALDAIEDLAGKFDRVLVVARSEAAALDDRVWQDRFVPYFKLFDPSFRDLEKVDEALDAIFIEIPELAGVVDAVRNELQLPRQATVEYAISDIDFGDNPNTGHEGISYSIPRLKEWAKAIEKWAASTPGRLRQLGQKAKRISRAKGLV
jgi:hypothetical protein